MQIARRNNAKPASRLLNMRNVQAIFSSLWKEKHDASNFNLQRALKWKLYRLTFYHCFCELSMRWLARKQSQHTWHAEKTKLTLRLRIRDFKIIVRWKQWFCQKQSKHHHSRNLNYRLIIDNIFSQLQWKNEVTSSPFEGHLMMNSQYTTMNV